MEVSDPLSDVLRSVRLRGSVFFYVSCRDNWSARAPGAGLMGPAVMPGSEHVMAYHMFVKGEGWVTIDGQEPVHLRAGDTVLLPHGDAHMVASAPGLAPKSDAELSARMRDGPKPISILYQGGACQVGHDVSFSDASTLVVCGFIACDLRPFNPLINTLPRLLHSPSSAVSAWVRPMLEQAAAEAQARRAGSALLLQRVSEMVFTDAARQHLDSLPPDTHGWLGALRDRRVGRAIELMHQTPSQPWTLDELGRRAGLSRSTLHERFVSLLGMPPMQYLTRWRMQAAARMLREHHSSVTSVAMDVGYDSESAFSKAFKRATGLPPAAWRRAQSQSLAAVSA